jgi:hypothetical protein
LPKLALKASAIILHDQRWFAQMAQPSVITWKTSRALKTCSREKQAVTNLAL